MLGLYDERVPVDLLTVQQRLKDAGQLEAVGGLGYLAGLPDAVPSEANLPYYLVILREKQALRELARTCGEIAEGIHLAEGSALDFARRARERLAALDLGGGGAPKKFTLWRPSQFLAWDKPAGYDILPEGRLCRGQIAAIIGAAGTGKSYFMLGVAVASLTGRDYFGLRWRPDGAPPQKWLFIGNENSASRWQADLLAWRAVLSADEWAAVEEGLTIQAVNKGDDADPDDDYIALDSPEQEAALTATIRRAAVTAAAALNVTFDPLANLANADDNLNEGAAMNRLLAVLRRCCRAGGARGGIFIVHHGSGNAEKIAAAVATSGGDYSTNSRRLVALARLVLNVFSVGDPDDPQDRRLLLQCGKINDAAPFPRRVFNFSAGPAGVAVPDFNLDAWLDEKRGNGPTKACSVDDVVAAVRAGHRHSGQIIAAAARATGCGDRTAERALRIARETRHVEKIGGAKGQYVLGSVYDHSATVPATVGKVGGHRAGRFRHAANPP
jgi:hypothetical protein